MDELHVDRLVEAELRPDLRDLVGSRIVARDDGRRIPRGEAQEQEYGQRNHDHDRDRGYDPLSDEPPHG